MIKKSLPHSRCRLFGFEIQDILSVSRTTDGVPYFENDDTEEEVGKRLNQERYTGEERVVPENTAVNRDIDIQFSGDRINKFIHQAADKHKQK